MTTGVPIYLVSACASGEEFISAFRRYADRNGVVFIPIGVPLPPGRKGRFALTLKDGGVMVEGEAEVVSSARTPSVLYGRVGMTLKFTEPDEPSKTLLGELEKARLQMKPAPPSVAPRPAEIPAEPRPTPPAPTGRIDAFNALAECVVIGDLSTLTSDDGPRSGPKFTVPSIPPLKTATGQAPVVARPATPPAALPVVAAKETVMGMPAIEKAPGPIASPMPVVAAKGTVMGMPAIGKAPAEREDSTMPTPAKVAAAAAAGSHDRSEVLQTVRGPAPAVDLISPGKKIDLNETMRGPAPKGPSTSIPALGTAPPPFVPRQATPAAPTPVVDAPPLIRAPAPPIIAARPLVVETSDADEPTDLTELPLMPVEQVTAELGGPDRTIREPRRTVIGISVVPSGVHVLPAAPAPRLATDDDSRDTSVMAVHDDELSGPVRITSLPPKEVVDADAFAAPRAGGRPLPSGVRNATVEEATPSGDWTMTPGEHGPTIQPRAPTPPPIAKAHVETEDHDEEAPIKQIPTSPTVPAPVTTGDWLIALDPSQPDGWSEPSKIEKRPEGLPPEPGPPVSTVASAKDLDSDAKVAPEPKTLDAPKVEIDPTLMEPLQPLQPIDDFDDEPQLPPAASMTALTGLEVPSPGQIHTPLPQIPTTPMQVPSPIPGAYVSPLPDQVPAYPEMAQPRYPTDASQPILDHRAAAKQRRMIVIGASAAGALLLVIILAMVLGGGNKKTDDDPTGSDTTTDHAVQDPPLNTTPDVVPPPSRPPQPPTTDGGGSAQQAIVNPAAPADAAEVQVATPDAAAEVASATDCVVEFSTAPQGAEILLDKSVLGTTPAKLTLPCGVESRLTFRKPRFVSAQRAVTPKSDGKRTVRVALARVTFTVKVSSSPPGATILLGAKSLGITPAVVRLPAFELATLKLTKDGYTPDIQKITPRTNNLSISSTLKRQVKKSVK